MTPDEFIILLGQRQFDPKAAGEGKWTACCPGHDDRKASLSIGRGQHGDVLVKCHVGCEIDAILAPLGISKADLFVANGNDDQPVAEHYIYEDADGVVVMRVTRKPGKKFTQSQPDGKGGWIWNTRGVVKPIYRKPQVLAAVAAGKTIYICEGEKDVQSLEAAGVIATTNPGGSGKGKWTDEHSSTLAGATCIVVADNDAPGRAHALRVAASLRAHGATVTIVQALVGKDATDHFAAGRSLAEFFPVQVEPAAGSEGPTRDPSKLSDLVVEQILKADPSFDISDLEDVDSPAELMKLLSAGRKSVATDVVSLVLEEAGVQLFHDPEDNPFATFTVDGHTETWRLQSQGFKGWVRRLYFDKRDGAALNGQAIADAIALLDAKARFDGPELQVHLRVAAVDGVIYIDLGDDAWTTVAIARTGWTVTSVAPVRFRRTRGMQPLPEPVRGGSLDLLREFVNVGKKDHQESEDSWRLIVAWLLAAARPGVPCPLLALLGEQGSAKSTAARVLRNLIDPSSVSLRASPSKIDDLMVSAASSWIVNYDNLSHLQPWFSDALCRLCTGGGLSKRELYTDVDEILLDAQRPVIINGIGELATRSDLLDRSLLVSLPVIPETEYVTEADFWKRFDAAHGRILGGLCDALTAALANVDQVHLDSKPRMADFATWVVAAEPALGWKAGSFLASYTANRKESHELAVDASSIAQFLRTIALQGFDGPAGKLLDLLNGLADDAAKRRQDWPKNARSLRAQITRLAPNLRRLGYVVDTGGSGHHRTIVLALTLADDQ